MDKEKEETSKELADKCESIEWTQEVDEEALNVIFRLYDNTIKDLVDR